MGRGDGPSQPVASMLRAVRLRGAAAAVGVRAPILVLCAAAFLGFAVAIPGFASAANVTGILIAALPLLLLAAGQTFVLISGWHRSVGDLDCGARQHHRRPRDAWGGGPCSRGGACPGGGADHDAGDRRSRWPRQRRLRRRTADAGLHGDPDDRHVRRWPRCPARAARCEHGNHVQSAAGVRRAGGSTRPPRGESPSAARSRRQRCSNGRAMA